MPCLNVLSRAVQRVTDLRSVEVVALLLFGPAPRLQGCLPPIAVVVLHGDGHPSFTHSVCGGVGGAFAHVAGELRRKSVDD